MFESNPTLDVVRKYVRHNFKSPSKCSAERNKGYLKHVSDDKKMDYSMALTRGFLNDDRPTTSKQSESTKSSKFISIHERSVLITK